MKLILLGEVRTNCGSIQAFRGYARAAQRLSTPLLVADTREVSPTWLESRANAADFVLFVIEHALCKNHDALVSTVPIEKRVLVDVDANLTIGNMGLRERLRGEFPIVLQPTTKSRIDGIIPFPFFGYEPTHELGAIRGKAFDLVYVGNNWFRIALIGKWWTGVRPQRLAYAVKTDRRYLATRGICVQPAVSHRQVSHKMGLGRVNAVLQRECYR